MPPQPASTWFLRERFVWGLVVILSLTGMFTWFNINEQEDPFMPYFNGFLAVEAPGLSASAMESTIVKPIERALATVDEIANVTVEISEGVASFDIELLETIKDTDSAWQRMRERLNPVKNALNDYVTTFELQDRVQDTEGVLLAIKAPKTSQPHKLSLLEMRQFALWVRDELYKLPSIRSIQIIGDPGERIDVYYPQENLLDAGIPPQAIAQTLAHHNALTPAGQLNNQTFTSSIESLTRLNTLEDIYQIHVTSPQGDLIPLSNIAQIDRVLNPVTTDSFWVNGEKTIGLTLVLPPNQIRVADFGKELLNKISDINQKSTTFHVKPIFFQPAWTEKRRDDLASSLLISSIAVGLVLFLLMSYRMALVVSLTIPTIALTAIAVYGVSGGVLHQMSIAGLVISLGLMVDNSIAMSELIARFREQGHPRFEASLQAIKTLYKPLATSTLTTVAAFVPMLLSSGGVAEFIRMVPVIVVISILVSYAYALFFVPTLTNNLPKYVSGQSGRWLDHLGIKVGAITSRFPKTIMLSVLSVIIASVTLSLSDDNASEFFPKTSRNQAYIDIEGTYGQSHEVTLRTVRIIEKKLHQFPDIKNVISFVGNSGPRFYYNLPSSPNEPHIARIVIETANSDIIPTLVNKLNHHIQNAVPNIRITAREIGQGPPIESPIDVWVLGDATEHVLAAAEKVFSLIQQHPNTMDSRRAYVMGKPSLNVVTDDVALRQAGLTRADISEYLAWRTTGLEASSLPQNRESLPIYVRDNTLIEQVNQDYLNNTLLMNRDGDIIPINGLATTQYKHSMPYATRRNGFHALSIKADLQPGADDESLIESLMPQFQKIGQQHGVTLEFGGEAEEEEDSSGALLKTLPIGMILLFAALILQFNSYRLALLVMLSIPLAMIGVLPTLALAGVQFGFMSILGLLALTGIVVNTAILLIDRIVTKVTEDDLPLIQAIEKSVQERFRPIILTTITTIVGMIPLTSHASPLWPPLAWTIIGGLITSTLLSLAVLPCLLRWFISEKRLKQQH